MKKHGCVKEDSGGSYCAVCGLRLAQPKAYGPNTTWEKTECAGAPPRIITQEDASVIADLLEGKGVLRRQYVKRLRTFAAWGGCRWRAGRE